MACVQLPWPRPPARQLAPQFRPHSTEPSYNPGTTSHQTAAGELEEARTNAAASRGHSGHLDSHLKPARNWRRLTHPSALFYPTCEQLWPSLQYSPEKHCYHCSNNLIKKNKNNVCFLLLAWPGSWSWSPVMSKVSGPRLRSCSHTGDTEVSLEPNTLATS